LEKGPTKDSVVHLDELPDDFYQIYGWDIETGIQRYRY